MERPAMKILIVDDNKQVRNFIKMVLRNARQSNEYVECSNGQDAIEMYDTEKPDLVLMDIMMDKMDGLTALRHIHAVHADSKIVIVSQLPEDEVKKEAINLGALGYLNKENLYKLPALIKQTIN